jgi:hypothetical protein
VHLASHALSQKDCCGLTCGFLCAGFISNVRPLLEEGRRQGFARTPDEVRKICADALDKLPIPVPLEIVSPILSQLSSCLMEVCLAVLQAPLHPKLFPAETCEEVP